jgi:hypothetical protein
VEHAPLATTTASALTILPFGQGKGGDTAIEPGDFHGNGHFGVEFLRLHEGGAGANDPLNAEFSWWRLRQRGCWRTVAIFPHAANLIVPRDWPVMRRRAAAKVQTNFIDIAPPPPPPFRRIVALDDRMAGLVKVLGGMTVWRAVAAADMAAGPAEAQMHPRRTKFQTFLASERARRYVTDASGVRTFVGH